MDAEIEALEQRRDKTADLKQAMMQELLTGKTRLVTPEASMPEQPRPERTDPEPRGRHVHRPDPPGLPRLSLSRRLAPAREQPTDRGRHAAGEPQGTRLLATPTSPPRCRSWRRPPTPPA